MKIDPKMHWAKLRDAREKKPYRQVFRAKTDPTGVVPHHCQPLVSFARLATGRIQPRPSGLFANFLAKTAFRPLFFVRVEA